MGRGEKRGKKKVETCPFHSEHTGLKGGIFRENTMDGASWTSAWNILASGHLVPDSTCHPDSAPWKQGAVHRRLQHHQHEFCEQKAALGEEPNRWVRKDRMERRKDIPRHSPVQNQPRPPASDPRTLESRTQRKSFLILLNYQFLLIKPDLSLNIFFYLVLLWKCLSPSNWICHKTTCEKAC